MVTYCDFSRKFIIGKNNVRLLILDSKDVTLKTLYEEVEKLYGDFEVWEFYTHIKPANVNTIIHCTYKKTVASIGLNNFDKICFAWRFRVN